jgi:hypothetical protein
VTVTLTVTATVQTTSTVDTDTTLSTTTYPSSVPEFPAPAGLGFVMLMLLMVPLLYGMRRARASLETT